MSYCISTRLFVEVYGVEILISFPVFGVSPIKIIGVFKEKSVTFGSEIEIQAFYQIREVAKNLIQRILCCIRNSQGLC